MKRLDEIEARTNAATDGQWEWEGEAKAEWEIGANSLVPSHRPDDPVLYGYGYDASGIEVSNDADAEFIAHARQDVPALVAALRAVLELHPREVVISAATEYGLVEGEAICAECIVNYEPAPYPCPTVAAIHQHLGGDA